jgi:hypothetical protein
MLRNHQREASNEKGTRRVDVTVVYNGPNNQIVL